MERYIADKTGKKYTAKQMRLKVVNELIKVLKTTRRLKVKTRATYIAVIIRNQSPLSLRHLYSEETEDKELEPLLKKCQVCALGALFISDLIIRDQYKVSEVLKTDNRGSIIIRLRPYFQHGQLMLIENAFESRCDHMGCAEEHSKNCPAKFNSSLPPTASDEEKLLRILRNIKRNDGLFIPFKKK